VSNGAGRPAVIFGGPSPEHDISILTGLQAARTLAKAGRSPACLYWSKTNAWFEVDERLEGADFADGVPRGSRPLRLVVGSGRGRERNAPQGTPARHLRSCRVLPRRPG